LKDKSSNLFEFELTLLGEGFKRIMGLDEVGRGCLAGPVVAGGVILSPNDIPVGITDSKKLRDADRRRLSVEIKDKAIYWTICECDIHEIDSLNILWASLKAMQKCENAENANPDYLLIDGNRYIPTVTPHSCLVKGDSRSASIAAASIIAKVYRDDLMLQLSKEYPEFNWQRNVGYPTRDHYNALNEFGITQYHRTGFNLKTTKIYQAKAPISL
jgi:ribonuclease HII